MEAGDPGVLARLAARGLGAAIVPASLAAAHAADCRAAHRRPELRGALALAWRSGGPASPAGRAFVAHALALSQPPPVRRARSRSAMRNRPPPAVAVAALAVPATPPRPIPGRCPPRIRRRPRRRRCPPPRARRERGRDRRSRSPTRRRERGHRPAHGRRASSPTARSRTRHADGAERRDGAGRRTRAALRADADHRCGKHPPGTSSAQAVVAFGRIAPTRATLDAPRGLGPAEPARRAGVDRRSTTKGDAAVVFPVCRDAGCRQVLVYLAVRAAGSSTFRSTRLADGSGPLPQVAAAINDRGDAMAVWTQASTLYARIRTAGGTLRSRRRVERDRPRPVARSQRRAQPPPGAARRVARPGRVRGPAVGGRCVGRPGARRRHLHGDAPGGDPGSGRRPRRLGGGRAGRLRFPGPRARRLDRL